jgi:hypothetical protein
MRVLSKIIVLLISIILLNSCKKGLFETCVEGKVLNKKTGATVANQKVYLLRQTAGNGFGGLGFEEVSSTTTSLGGYYKFVFKAKGETYFIQGTDDSSNDPRFFAGQPTGSIKNGKTSTVDVELEPKAFLNLYVKNIAPFDSTDYFEYKFFTNSNTQISFGSGNGSEVANFQNKILVKEVEEIVNFRYTFIKNNVSKSKDTSFYLPSYITLNFQINY